MNSTTRLKINITTGEIELEGSEEFVTGQISNLQTLIDLVITMGLSKAPVEPSVSSDETTSQPSIPDASEGQLVMPSTFGEMYHKFPKKLQQTDQMLVAGYYQQKQSTENSFETSQANTLLKDQGIKITNPAVCLTRLKASKFTFPVGKRGKLNLYRVSKTGESHLVELLKS